MITFYFLRHGQTMWNNNGKYQGSTDVPLNETGERQAALAARWFDDEEIDAIYTSPLTRAAKTAECLGRRKGLTPIVKPEFQEICFGKWEGLTYDEIEARWPGAIEVMYDHPEKLRIEGGETFQEVQDRTMKGLRDLLAQGDNKTYVIVSHGAAIRTMLCGLLQLPLHMAWHLCQSNANISAIHYYGEGQSWLYMLNSQEHLKEIGKKQYLRKLPGQK